MSWLPQQEREARLTATQDGGEERTDEQTDCFRLGGMRREGVGWDVSIHGEGRKGNERM